MSDIVIRISRGYRDHDEYLTLEEFADLFTWTTEEYQDKHGNWCVRNVLKVKKR